MFTVILFDHVLLTIFYLLNDNIIKDKDKIRSFHFIWIKDNQGNI